MDLELEILEKALDAVWILNEDNTVAYLNFQACLMVQKSKEEVIGSDFSQFLPPKVAQNHNQLIQRFISQNPVSSSGESTVLGKVRELALVTGRGVTIPIELKAFEISPLNGVRRFVGFMRDISDRKSFEKSTQLMIQTFRNLAYIDELTMISNRRAFFESFKKIIATVNRRNREVVLAVLDIDKFKEINDTYGHHIGDSVLKSIAQIFQECLRLEDILGRLGGEEFGILLPDTTLNQARIVLERVRESVERHDFFVFENYNLKVTVSIGYASVPAGYLPEEVIKLADIALYEAKNQGRNQVVEYLNKG